MVKKFLSISLLLSLFCFSACSETSDVPGNGSTVSHTSKVPLVSATSDVSSDSSEGTAYIPGDPSTAPMILTEVPETWEFVELLGESTYPRDHYIETVSYDDGVITTDYIYHRGSGRLWSFHSENTRTSYTEKADDSYTEEELKQIANEFIKARIPNETASRITHHIFRDDGLEVTYSLPEEYGDWVCWHIADDTESTVYVNTHGDVTYFSNRFFDEWLTVRIPDVSLDEITARMQAEESHPGDRYKEQEGVTFYDNELDHLEIHGGYAANQLIVFAEVNGKYQPCFWGMWQAVEAETGEEIASQTYLYPFTDFEDGYVDVDAFDAFFRLKHPDEIK